MGALKRLTRPDVRMKHLRGSRGKSQGGRGKAQEEGRMARRGAMVWTLSGLTRHGCTILFWPGALKSSMILSCAACVHINSIPSAASRDGLANV